MIKSGGRAQDSYAYNLSFLQPANLKTVSKT